VISGVPGASKFKNPPGLFTIDYLGGWKKAKEKFFEKETGLVTKIEESLGVSTSK
jgi:sulfate/thiosulfate transport system substrate-binding protein